MFVACQPTWILDFFYRPSRHDVARTAAMLELPLESEIRGRRRRRRRRREKVYKHKYIIDCHAILHVRTCNIQYCIKVLYIIAEC